MKTLLTLLLLVVSSRSFGQLPSYSYQEQLAEQLLSDRYAPKEDYSGVAIRLNQQLMALQLQHSALVREHQKLQSSFSSQALQLQRVKADLEDARKVQVESRRLAQQWEAYGKEAAGRLEQFADLVRTLNSRVLTNSFNTITKGSGVTWKIEAVHPKPPAEISK